MAYSGRNQLPTFETIKEEDSCDRRSTYLISFEYSTVLYDAVFQPFNEAQPQL